VFYAVLMGGFSTDRAEETIMDAPKWQCCPLFYTVSVRCLSCVLRCSSGRIQHRSCGGNHYVCTKVAVLSFVLHSVCEVSILCFTLFYREDLAPIMWRKPSWRRPKWQCCPLFYTVSVRCLSCVLRCSSGRI